MPKFTVTLSAGNAEPIITEPVKANDKHEAMHIVFDLLKLDPRVVDAKVWEVTIEDLTDA